MIYNIYEIKEAFMADIFKYVENMDTDERNYQTNKRLDLLKDSICEIAQEMNVSVNQEYISSQLEVLKNQIMLEDNQNKEELLSIINNLSQKYADEIAMGEQPESLDKVKDILHGQLQENREIRKNSDSKKQMIIEEYVQDSYSNIMRRLFDLGFNNGTIEKASTDFKYEMSRLVNRRVEDICEYSNSVNIQLFDNIYEKFEAFFRDISKAEETRKEDKNKQSMEDKMPWGLSEEEMNEIDPKKAIELANKKDEEKIIDLPDNIIE